MKKMNRGWVKNAAIIVLVILLGLTFFSNTIMNISLAQVDVSQPTSGTITEKASGSATVEANNSYSIETDTAREVLAVYVKDGDEVEEGDLLFELAEGDGDDALSEAVSSLNEQRLAYQKALLDLAYSDYAADNESVRQAREDLEKASRERSALGTATTTVTAAAARVTSAEATYNTLANQLANLEAELDYIDSLSSRSSYIGTEVIAYETAVAKVDSIKAQMGGMTYTEFTALISELEDELVRLRQELADLQAAGASSSQISAKQSAITATETQLNGYYSQSATMSQLNADLSAAQSEVNSAESKMRTAAASARSTVAGEVSSMSARVNEAAAAKTTAENTYNTVRAIDEAEQAVTLAQQNLNNALVSLTSKQSSDSLEDSKALLDIQAMEEDMEKLEEKIQRLEDGTDGDGNTITAKYDGVISGLTAVAGRSTEPGTPLAEILVTDMGYTAEISVENKEASEVKRGATVDVTTSGWTEVTGVVAEIKTDPENPSTHKRIVVTLEGDVTVGSQVQLAIHLSSQQYNTIVPRSAIMQDTDGYHVYVVQSKSSILGTQYVANRVSVTVEAQDDSYAAINEVLERSDRVITRSSETIQDKDNVRLAD